MKEVDSTNSFESFSATAVNFQNLLSENMYTCTEPTVTFMNVAVC